MRKLLAVVLVTSMVISMTACGAKKDDNKETTAQQTTTAAENNDANASDDVAQDDTQSDAQNDANTGDTIGASIISDFKTKVSDGMSTEELANALCENPVLVFGPATMPVEEGLLNGFDNAEITGFSEGTMFAPMIGSIPFVGYVFQVKDDVNVDDFMATLKESANLRWNICTEADEMVVEKSGQTVLFVMCPSQFEE